MNDQTQLEQLLLGWLPQQRWFGAKGRALRSVTVESEHALVPGTGDRGLLSLLVLRVNAADGPAVDGQEQRYQVLLGRRKGPVEPRLEHWVLGELDGATVYDAVHDHDAMSTLLALLSRGGEHDGLVFTVDGELDPAMGNRVLGAEQSNTSVVFGEAVILKLFRRLQPGANPDIEVTKALAGAGSTHIACPLAWFDGPVAGEPTTLGLAQVFQRGASDGWAMATASVRDLFAEGDLHADEVGGDFAGESERLGVATAEVHALMASTLSFSTAGPDDARATAQQLHDRLERALVEVPELATHADALHAAYDEVGRREQPTPVQRVHGDYHLGQVLRTQQGWVLLDFEGEPARPLAERRAQMSPLRDVAGMMRSFDYAARHLLAEQTGASGRDPQLAYRATEWAERNRQAFCDGYTRAAGSDPRDQSVLLRAFELDKAVYEVLYEARNRPAWLAIPLGSIERLVGELT